MEETARHTTPTKATSARRKRFGYGFYGTGRKHLATAIRDAESYGYDTFVMPDHLAEQLSPIPALAAAAQLSSTLRIAPWVLCNDFHIPQIVARELATLDELSNGRLDVGLGAGWVRIEYERAGIAFDSGGERLRRLKDSVEVVRAMLHGGAVTIKNGHHDVRGLVGYPTPIQKPHAPLMLGGGGKQMLTWAATEADIVSIIPAAAPNGGILASGLTIAALLRKIGWVEESAGPRFGEITLNLAMIDVTITPDRRSVARATADAISSGKNPMFVVDGELTEDDLLESPYFAFGTAKEVAEHIDTVFEQTGVSYYGLFPHLADVFGPILEHVAR